MVGVEKTASHVHRRRTSNRKEWEQARFGTCTITQHLTTRQAERYYVGYEHGFDKFSDPTYAEKLRRRVDFPVHDADQHARLLREGGIIAAHWGPLLDARRGLLSLGIHGAC